MAAASTVAVGAGLTNIVGARNAVQMANQAGDGGGSSSASRRDGDATGVEVGGEPWKALEPGAKQCQSGCEAVAESIQRTLGGEIKSITGPGPLLGRVRNSAGDFVNPAGSMAPGWNFHRVVVKDGRVYDALTGPSGMEASAYKRLWEYGDVLDFGF